MQKKYCNLQGIKSRPKDRLISPKFTQALAAIPKEIASEQDRVVLVGVQTEDVSVQLFRDAVFGRTK